MKRSIRRIRQVILSVGAAEALSAYLLAGLPNALERPRVVPVLVIFTALGVLPFVIALRFPRREDWFASALGVVMLASNVYLHIAFVRDTHSTRGLLLLEAISVSWVLIGIGVGVGVEIHRRTDGGPDASDHRPPSNPAPARPDLHRGRADGDQS